MLYKEIQRCRAILMQVRAEMVPTELDRTEYAPVSENYGDSLHKIDSMLEGLAFNFSLRK